MREQRLVETDEDFQNLIRLIKASGQYVIDLFSRELGPDALRVCRLNDMAVNRKQWEKILRVMVPPPPIRDAKRWTAIEAGNTLRWAEWQSQAHKIQQVPE
ncbi:hypothetical protein GCM10010873_05460 [Cypionkella aquatica]|uniref:Uncharacterized protein n=1 Tax=Cypionkella aquatica TaxID=1756042 RepID=A0AA37TQY5_9RHOB|nr:hypothetical protein GCM10010873_05460 [Cypionkella aquatica]